MDLLEKIETRCAVVSVLGLGYVGLPLAVEFAKAGFRVVGIDIDPVRVESVNRGHSYIQGVNSELLAPFVLDGSHVWEPWPESGTTARGGQLSATADYDALDHSDAVIVCVPTPLSKTREPEVSYIISAADDIARHLHPDMLVVLESTTYPGTTEELILPRLSASNPVGGSELEAGKDFFLAFSPERIDPGRTDWTISNTPRVIGGVTQRCGEVARALYDCVVQETVPVSSTRVAEMVKLLENTFRAANIGLANEIAIMCDRLGVDVWEVIEAASTKPFGFMPFYPGPGLGGHCIPVDPQYLAWKLKTLDYNARFIQLAAEINFAMPLYWVNKVQDVLNEHGKPVKGSSVIVLGVAYKRDTADTRESPALDIIGYLSERGAKVSYHDPFVPVLRTDTYELDSVSDADLYEHLARADCIIIATDHSNYDWKRVKREGKLIVDTRNALGRLPEGAAGQALSPQLGMGRS